MKIPKLLQLARDNAEASKPIRSEVRATPERGGLHVSHRRLSSSPPSTATCSGTNRPNARQA